MVVINMQNGRFYIVDRDINEFEQIPNFFRTEYVVKNGYTGKFEKEGEVIINTRLISSIEEYDD